MGKPDAVFSDAGGLSDSRPSGTIDYKYFEVPTNLHRGQVGPGDRSARRAIAAVVHHVIVYARTPPPATPPPAPPAAAPRRAAPTPPVHRSRDTAIRRQPTAPENR